MLSFPRYIISTNLILQKTDRYFQMITALDMNLDFHQSQRVPRLKLYTLKRCPELRGREWLPTIAAYGRRDKAHPKEQQVSCL